MLPRLAAGLAIDVAETVAPETTAAAATAARALLTDVAGAVERWSVKYPTAEALLKQPLEALKTAFAAQRDGLTESLAPAEKLLPQLGVHGTSLESGTRILASRAASPLDFATFPSDSAAMGASTYLSEVGSAMQSGASFSEKWLRLGKQPGPILVMDISKARAMPFTDVSMHREAAWLGKSLGEDPVLAPFSLPKARAFEATIYNP